MTNDEPKRIGPYPLFYRDDMEAWFIGNYKEVETQIAAIPAESLEKESAEISREYFGKFKIEPLIFDYDSIETEIKEVVIESADGDKISKLSSSLMIPFIGNRGIVIFKPRKPRGWSASIYFEDSKLILELPIMDFDQEVFRRVSDGVLQKLRNGVDDLNASVNEYNKGLNEVIDRAVSNKLAGLNKKRDFMASLGYPIKENNKEEIEVETSIATVAPVGVTIETGKQVMVVKRVPLNDKAFYEVLNAISKTGIQWEHAYKSFNKSDEVVLRNNLVANLRLLDTSYSITGESYNGEGKSDIMVMSGKEVLIVGECKFWRGEKAFLDSIDQLYSYISRHNNRMVIVIFDGSKTVRSKTVISKIAIKHISVLRELENNEKDWQVFEFRNPKDPEVIGSLGIIRIHLPADSQPLKKKPPLPRKANPRIPNKRSASKK